MNDGVREQVVDVEPTEAWITSGQSSCLYIIDPSRMQSVDSRCTIGYVVRLRGVCFRVQGHVRKMSHMALTLFVFCNPLFYMFCHLHWCIVSLRVQNLQCLRTPVAALRGRVE